ncbi:M42 family peptidase [Clostridium swellfunianum]|uniref:M42 family peptidase n=1 Tax=Clostridium swellfunianum TaxID=1367462 RepID=UPI00202F578E|nr:M42 family peptidase [Clostridium swellfunianum]MCM0648231.1 M42 family peptidase [Clostridium swellfunianum]
MDDMLKRVLSSFGVSGHEEEVRKTIIDELKNVKCDIKEDKMGNLIVKIGEGTDKLMLCAHMDQIGLIASFIEDNGFIRVGSLGNFNTTDIVHNLVRFENGTFGKVAASKSNAEIGDLYIDIGVSSREEALKKVREGDVACFLGNVLAIDNKIISQGLDNRVGCYVLLRLIKELNDVNQETYFVFSSQAELGGRGARAASFAIEPDRCIVVDLEEAGDSIGGKGNIKIGEGPVLTVMDRSLIMHHEIKESLEAAAKQKSIKLQYASVNRITDGGAIHKEKSGVKTGVVSVPCRYNHSISEMVCTCDIENTIELLKNLI